MTTWTPTTKSSSSFSTQTKSVVGSVSATAGLYRGFGAFTYSGGEVLVAGSAPTYTAISKSASPTFTNITKS